MNNLTTKTTTFAHPAWTNTKAMGYTCYRKLSQTGSDYVQRTQDIWNKQIRPGFQHSMVAIRSKLVNRQVTQFFYEEHESFPYWQRYTILATGGLAIPCLLGTVFIAFIGTEAMLPFLPILGGFVIAGSLLASSHLCHLCEQRTIDGPIWRAWKCLDEIKQQINQINQEGSNFPEITKLYESLNPPHGRTSLMHIKTGLDDIGEKIKSLKQVIRKGLIKQIATEQQICIQAIERLQDELIPKNRNFSHLKQPRLDTPEIQISPVGQDDQKSEHPPSSSSISNDNQLFFTLKEVTENQ